jgi:DNA helicase HerA-like ATPase
MLSKHFAVLGSTGVGKSTGVSLLLNEILEARPNLRIFLLDVAQRIWPLLRRPRAGAQSAQSEAAVLAVQFRGNRRRAVRRPARRDEELDILAEVIPMAKGIYTQYQNADRVGLKRIDPKRSATPSTRRCPTAWST